MKTGIWLTGLSLLCMSISAQTLAGDQGLRGNAGGNGQGGDVQQQLNQQRSAERQQQQQINQQQREQQRVFQSQQNQVRQADRQQQQQIQQQDIQLRNVERQQQQQINQQQREQQRQIQQQQNQVRQTERQQLRQAQDNLPIQSGPRESWQTQQPRQGYYQDIPRGGNRNWQAGRPDDRWEGRPDGRGNGWGPGPQYRPGHAIDRVPGGYSRVPYRGQDYFYADGYWYRPQGQRYVVVSPPYGARVRALPSYSQEVWIGSSLLFLAAGNYYTYQPNTQEYVVVTPPSSQPVYAEPVQGSDYDPQAFPLNGQSQQQVELDHYQCYRWAAEQSGFDPANVTYQPAPEVVDQYRRAMGACLVERGYRVQ